MANNQQATVALIKGVDQAPEIAKIDIPSLEPLAMMTEIEAATLCGTDIHLWHTAEKSMPYIPGHESCGIVTKKNGDRYDVTGELVEIGDRMIWAYPFCGECFYCTVANQPTMCDNAARFGREPVPGLHLLLVQQWPVGCLPSLPLLSFQLFISRGSSSSHSSDGFALPKILLALLTTRAQNRK